MSSFSKNLEIVSPKVIEWLGIGSLAIKYLAIGLLCFHPKTQLFRRKLKILQNFILFIFKLLHLLLISISQLPIHTSNSPLRIFHQQLLDRNHQRRVIIPALLQKIKPQILPRIRCNAWVSAYVLVVISAVIWRCTSFGSKRLLVVILLPECPPVVTTLKSQRRNVLEFVTQAVSAKRLGKP